MKAYEMTTGLLVSMAMRHRHDFGLLSDNQKRSLLQMMSQLYEEVSGNGFYSPERESEYAAMYQHPLFMNNTIQDGNAEAQK